MMISCFRWTKGVLSSSKFAFLCSFKSVSDRFGVAETAQPSPANRQPQQELLGREGDGESRSESINMASGLPDVYPLDRLTIVNTSLAKTADSEDDGKERENVVLISTGSYNPVWEWGTIPGWCCPFSPNLS